MQTSEKIKRGLECVCCGECPWLSEDGCMWSDDFAIALIQQLEQDNAQKDERIRELEREKEAMLRDMKAWPACDACKHRNLLCTQKPCSECREAGNGKTVMWEWRGVEEGEHA